MANITAGLVKELRDKTGAGMMECKKALQKAEGELDKAIKLLRESGAAKAAKREARTAAEGLVDIATNSDSTAAGLAELNCETDFVARNEEFQEAVKAMANAALDSKVTSGNQLGDTKLPDYGKTATEVVTDLRAKIGEKIEIQNAEYISEDVVAGYIHPPGKIGVVVAAKLNGAKPTEELQETLRGIAMHIAAINPRFLTEDEIDQSTADAEREIFVNIAKKEGKPENIIPKIVEGRMKAFYKENCLVSQIYVKDGKKTVQEIVDEAGKAAGGSAKLTRFVRFQVGEHVDKTEQE